MADEIKPSTFGSTNPVTNQSPEPSSLPMSDSLPSNLPVKDTPNVPSGPFGADIKIKPPISSFLPPTPTLSPGQTPKSPPPYPPPSHSVAAPSLSKPRSVSPISPPPRVSPPQSAPPSRQFSAISGVKVESLDGQAKPTTSSSGLATPEVPKPPLQKPSGIIPVIPTPPPVFKSSIRTMQEDLAALKKGQQPTGAKLEKQSELEAKPPSETGLKISPPPPLKIGHKVELGKLEKSKPIFGLSGGIIPAEAKQEGKPSTSSILGLGKAKPSKEPTLPPPGSAIKIQEKEGPLGGWGNIAIDIGGKRRVLLLAVGGIAAISIFIFWVLRNVFETGEVTFSQTPTPSLTASPTATITPLENYFSIVESLNLALGPEFVTAFEAKIDKQGLSTSRVPALYRLLDAAGSKRHGFRDIMDTLLIPVPAGIQNSISDKDFYLTAFYKNDGEIGYGFITKVNDIFTTKTALAVWEATITDNLKNFFQYNDKDAASTVFLDNTYNGVAIRYRNFPDHNLTIDYAIVSALNGNSYLIFTNSREHIYSIIDRIK